ncbi:hypothetical protein ACFP81_02940 [Deinococcus lacus]|uniref:Ig-like domain-containing protein n=1 Tax=Deinococcus lacus TaxID=392561 RepID=A0ABW1Y9W8_9DEIO
MLRLAAFSCLLACWSAAAAQGSCNAYFPAQPGWVWTYQVTSQGKAQPATTTRFEVSGDTLTAINGQHKTKYRCRAGALTSLTPPTIGGATLTRAAVTGVHLPAAAEWKVGHTWKQVWALEGRRGPLSGKGTLTTSYRIIAQEKVRVPAGEFTAFKVSAQTQVTGQAIGMNMNQDLGTASLWYAKGTGLVKMQQPGYESVLVRLQK